MKRAYFEEIQNIKVYTVSKIFWVEECDLYLSLYDLLENKTFLNFHVFHRNEVLLKLNFIFH